jgi:hypothetical protein
LLRDNISSSGSLDAAVGSPLPTPDAIDSTPIAMAAIAAKVALVNTAVSGMQRRFDAMVPHSAQIIDLIG